MNVFLLGFLFVIVIPLAEGVLLAFLLREVYVWHPLPLGGVIVPRWWDPPKPAAREFKSAKVQKESFEFAEPVPAEAEGTGGSPETLTVQDAPREDTLVADPIVEQSMTPPSGVSVFDGTENIPQGLSVNNVLNAMTTDAPAANVDNLERIIDESARTEDNFSEKIHAIVDDMNHDDLQALAEALPRTKIDLAQEIELDSEDPQVGMSMAKDVLGENFDFDALEKQAQRTKETFKFLVPVGSIEAGSMKIPLDIREDESGTVQVSSSFVANTVPQLTDFATPQTIVSFFSNDWIQESKGMAEFSEGDTTQFCFTEESLPMFVRKKGYRA